MIEVNKKKVGIKTLGERLREIREKAGVSIDEIAKVTKINKKYLKLIEADDYERLPSDVYVKGFLRGYSNFLGLESKDVLKIYKKERGIQANSKKPKIQDFKRKKVKAPIVILPFKVVVSILTGIFFIGIIWYFYIETGKFSEDPRLLISKPLSNVIVKDNFTEIIGVTDIGNQVVINGQQIFVDEKGGFREKISLKSGMNELVIKSVNKFNKEVEKKIRISAQYEKVLPENNNEEEKEEVINNKIRLMVKAEGLPVWISVRVDGKNVYKGTMLANTEQTFEGGNDIKITSGMANRTLIKVDNESEYHKLAENTGVIRDVLFVSKSIKEDVEK
jgi:transcriptional regulator with XRE-family HTH domain